ncbi:MFS transporter [Dactylosporangium roseum]|uniref:MFS transporter n=1 Tax=Dactylosporangium roseum TaxID=47989 RepID=A0ABY5YZA3_9ACTN|nr:MFS transporter [Dactylosporangium roseum]UWZ34714.1 MFS transporter [Dactylosporangium roseum]
MGADYGLLLFAFVTSGLGNWIYRLALPLMILERTGSALNTAVVYALEYAPLLVLSLPGGVFADRFDRRRILVAGDLTAAVLAGLLAVAVTVGSSSLLMVYLAAFLLACVEPLYYPAFQGLVPALAGKRDLERANAWLQAGDNVMSLAGPAVAGVLIAVLGFQGAIWVDAGTFAVSALTILAIRKKAGNEPGERTPPGLLGEIRAALVHIVRDNRILLSGSVLFALANFGTWSVQANLVYYLSDYRAMSPALVGVVMSAQGVGAVLGAAICPWLGHRFPPGRIILVGTVLAGAGIVALIPLRDVVSISIMWALVYGIGTVNMVTWFVLRQRIVPPELLGRVVALTRMVVFLSIPAAALLAGALEQRLHNMYLIIALAGGLRIVAGLGGLATPLRSRIGAAEPPASATVAAVR